MKKIYKIFTLGFLALVALGSCSDDFGDINVHPEQPTETVPDYIFTVLIRGIGYIGNANLYIYNPQTLPVTRLATNFPADDFDQLTNSSGVDGVWGEYYGKLRNISALRDLISESPSDPERHVNQLAMLEIYDAYFALKVADKFGDVPYSEAGNGLSDLNYRPVYEEQGAIFNTVLTKLQAAIGSMKLTASTPAGEGYFDFDANALFYPGGSSVDHFTNWAKFGNSLVLKYALRMSKFDQSGASGFITTALAGPLMSSIADGAQIVPTDLGPNSDNATRKNAWSWARYFNTTSQPAQFMASKFAVAADISMIDEATDDIFDPRFFGTYFPNKNGEYKILPNDLDDAAAEAPNVTQSQIYKGGQFNKKLYADYMADGYGASHAIWNRMYTMSFFLGQQMLTYSEHCLVLAEIYADPGLPSGDAQEMYELGVTAAVKEFFNIDYAHYPGDNPTRIITVTDAEIATMLAHPNVAYNAGNALELIRTQRWIDYLYRPDEAWSLIRRTNLFDLETTVPIKNNGTTVEMIYKLPYASSELDYNTSNYLDQVNKMGGTDDIRYKADIFK